MMARPKKVEENTNTVTEQTAPPAPTIHDIEWTDYVLSFLTDDEKIMGNPTTDGLRRIFEKVMDCQIVESESKVVQCPSRENEMRATVQFVLTFKPNVSNTAFIDSRSVSGCADVYWGNCDKVFRNHPVAVAETRAEGRALRRALRLRKVVAAEEIATEIEDDITGDSVGKITSTQVNFIDVMARRIDINMKKMLESININLENIYELTHDQAIDIIRKLSTYQQSVASIPDSIKIYEENWK
jgi:hypothetical protein